VHNHQAHDICYQATLLTLKSRNSAHHKYGVSCFMTSVSFMTCNAGCVLGKRLFPSSYAGRLRTCISLVQGHCGSYSCLVRLSDIGGRSLDAVSAQFFTLRLLEKTSQSLGLRPLSASHPADVLPRVRTPGTASHSKDRSPSSFLWLARTRSHPVPTRCSPCRDFRHRL
jgi:hypothetical protein